MRLFRQESEPKAHGPAWEFARKELGMNGKKDGRTAFTLVLDTDAARPRKTMAPAGKPHADQRRKPPRRRPDYLAERSHFAETDE